MKMNYLVFFIAALVPVLIGFIWYGPLLGNAWRKEINFRKESFGTQNRSKVFILSYVFSLLVAFFLQFIVIHQGGLYSTLLESGATKLEGDTLLYFEDFMAVYGDKYRTFKHGALHGVLSGVFFALPLFSIMAVFENKSAKYITINAGYWILCLGIMGGIIGQWL